MATGFHCPSMTAGLMCDQPAVYLVNGTALCRTHAKEVVVAVHRALAIEQLRQHMPPNTSG